MACGKCGCNNQMIQNIKASYGDLMLNVLVENKIVKDKSEGRRLFLQNQIINFSNNEILKENSPVIGNMKIKVGNNKFYEIKI